ncbi:MAG: hypothetical protein HRT65_16400 [Flavobacteriaceae bacterium]|nr:hypothetical protein [Flavobacteriaceae bacterium]
MALNEHLPFAVYHLTADRLETRTQEQRTNPCCGIPSLLWLAAFWSVLFSISLAAQTGPAGVGSSDDNLIWIAADGQTFTDAGISPANNNTLIYQWSDRSGNGHHFMESIATNRPVYQTNVLNGFGVARFDGQHDRMLVSGLPHSDQASFFVVVKQFRLRHDSDGIFQGSPPGLAFSRFARHKSVGMWTFPERPSLGRVVQTDETWLDIPPLEGEVTTPIGPFHIISQQMDGQYATQYLNLERNGTIAYDGTVQAWSEFGIGRQGEESLDGQIAELLVYNRNVNQAERLIINNYLSAKYAIPLAQDDLYIADNPEHGDFDYEVAGIGQFDLLNTQTDAQGSGSVRINNAQDTDDGEFLLWGHDQGLLEFNEADDVPKSVRIRLGRSWRVSEVVLLGHATDLGAVDLTIDLNGIDGLTGLREKDLRLIVDSDNDGTFETALVLGNAQQIGIHTYTFSGVTALVDGARFTFGIGKRYVITNRRITYRVRKD